MALLVGDIVPLNKLYTAPNLGFGFVFRFILDSSHTPWTVEYAAEDVLGTSGNVYWVQLLNPQGQQSFLRLWPFTFLASKTLIEIIEEG